MSSDSIDISDRVGSEPSPGRNQAKAEPMPATGDRGDPAPSPVTDANEAEGEERQDAANPAGPLDAGVPSPGDLHGVNAPAVQAAAGTSQQAVPVTALAPPGKPDGEVDTRT